MVQHAAHSRESRILNITKFTQGPDVLALSSRDIMHGFIPANGAALSKHTRLDQHSRRRRTAEAVVCRQ